MQEFMILLVKVTIFWGIQWSTTPQLLPLTTSTTSTKSSQFSKTYLIFSTKSLFQSNFKWSNHAPGFYFSFLVKVTIFWGIQWSTTPQLLPLTTSTTSTKSSQFSKTYLIFSTKSLFQSNFKWSNHAPGFYFSFLFFQENSNESQIVVKKDKDPSIDVSKWLKRIWNN
jgi:hypothetical protein